MIQKYPSQQEMTEKTYYVKRHFSAVTAIWPPFLESFKIKTLGT